VEIRKHYNWLFLSRPLQCYKRRGSVSQPNLFDEFREGRNLLGRASTRQAWQNGNVDVNSHSGVLPEQAIRAFLRDGVVSGVTEFASRQVQPASLDLRLGNVAYRVRASFLPGIESTVIDRLHGMDAYEIDLSGSQVLEFGQVYVIPVQESLDLPAQIRGFANARSTTGRLDIFTRLVTDYGNAFNETIRGYSGPLYVEVAPKTFSIVVKPGTCLNQIRFQRNTNVVLEPSKLRVHYFSDELVAPHNPNTRLENGLVPVTVDLKGDRDQHVIGYRAKKHTDRIDLDKINYYNPEDYWEPIFRRKELTLTLDPGEFYILATHEAVRVPPPYAAEMVPYATQSGEFRVHYAGFFDPGFGWDSAIGASKAVLEVRSHGVPFMLEDRQTIGWLRYEHMADIPDHLYGPEIGSSYHGQGLALARQFRLYPVPIR
jgi:dCTP deaminase